MPSFNKIMLMGNLTRDPELRYIPSGQPVCEFGLAINRFWNSQNGERREETCFIDITVWGKQGERCAEYLKKGKPIFLDGYLKFESWQAQDGTKRSKHRVVADRIQFLDFAARGANGEGAARNRAADEAFADSAPPQEVPVEAMPSSAEDVPF